MNYGEELAYWYLRFNGFFPLTNFVLHRDDNNNRPSDCDLLAIRHPFVYEEVGGQSDDWDSRLADFLDLDNKTIGIICEVKTGRIGQIFKRSNVDRAVSRLGFFADAEAAKAQLSSQHTYSEANFQINKLLIADIEQYPQSSASFISLTHARSFLKERIIKYQNTKVADRLFFNSSLLQELIWDVRRNNSF
jgi:hypothetical protein